jgi:tetratricopeptide (TPR) repeat protein
MPPDNDVQKEIEQLEERYAQNSQGLVFAHLADAYRKAGDYAKAEGLILHGLKMHPNYISAHNVLGRVYLDAERFSDAHEQFSKVLELDPQNMIALKALGDLAVNGGRLEDARSWYERILQIDPRNEEVLKEMENLGGAGGEPAAPGASPAPAVGEAAEPPTPAPQAEEEAQPWDMAELVGEESELGPEEIPAAPLDGVISGEGMAAVNGDDDFSSTASWEGLSDVEAPVEPDVLVEPEALADPETLDIEPAIADGFGETGEAPAEPTPEPLSLDDTSPEAKAGEAQEFSLGDMDDWTPGFLSADEIEGPAGSDLGSSSLMDEFGGDLGLDSLGEEDAVEADLPTGEGMVTETMAELYADQGLYEDALGVYRELAVARPEDERISARIAELEQMAADARSAPASDDDLAALLDLTEPSDALEPLAEPEAMAELGPVVDLELPGEPEPLGLEPEPPVELAPESLLDEGIGESAAGEAAAEAKAGFRFEDEAPVAGMDHLDPFASSFEAMVQRGDAAQEPTTQGSLAELVEPEPAEPEAVPIEMEPVVAEAVPAELDIGPAEDLLPPGADIPYPEEADVPAAEVAAPAAMVSGGEPGAVPTIEEYLSGLLAYDVEARAEEPKPSAAQEPSTPPASGASDAPGSEDLEQFQEWLRSLKE